MPMHLPLEGINNQFIVGFRSAVNLSEHAIFNYILKFLHTGCQWENLAIKTDQDCLPEIHYTRIYSKFRYWVATGPLAKIFENTVMVINDRALLDLSIIQGICIE
jgi:hypothetical protein